MGLATLFVLVASSTIISLIRNMIPKQVRIASFIIIIATFVTMVDYLIQSISLELYNALGAFIQLIVANCVILGRAEAYASKQKWVLALLSPCSFWVLQGNCLEKALFLDSRYSAKTLSPGLL